MGFSINSNVITPTVVPGGVDQSGLRAPLSAVNTDAAEAKQVIQKAASDVVQTKNQVGIDLEKIQQSLEASVNQLNDMLKGAGRNLSIGVDSAVSGPVITVRNSETGEVVRQIPNEVVVRVAHNIEAFKGWLHDQKV
jgi:flagellar protein FlaG